MVKKILLINLVCLGLSVFLASQVSAGCCCNPRFCSKYIRGSVTGIFTACDEIENLVGKTLKMRLFSPTDGELTGTVICARDSKYPRIRYKRIKRCRSGNLPKCLYDYLCKAIPGEIDYDNSNPLVAETEFLTEDCDEVCCTETLKIIFEEELFNEPPCPDGWNYAGFIPDNEPDPLFLEGIVVDVENIENCPIDGFIFPDLLQTDRCTDLSGNEYLCEDVSLEELEGGAISGYPGGYGGFSGTDVVDVCDTVCDGYGGYGGIY